MKTAAMTPASAPDNDSDMAPGPHGVLAAARPGPPAQYPGPPCPTTVYHTGPVTYTRPRDSDSARRAAPRSPAAGSESQSVSRRLHWQP